MLRFCRFVELMNGRRREANAEVRLGGYCSVSRDLPCYALESGTHDPPFVNVHAVVAGGHMGAVGPPSLSIAMLWSAQSVNAEPRRSP